MVVKNNLGEWHKPPTVDAFLHVHPHHWNITLTLPQWQEWVFHWPFSPPFSGVTLCFTKKRKSHVLHLTTQRQIFCYRIRKMKWIQWWWWNWLFRDCMDKEIRMLKTMNWIWKRLNSLLWQGWIFEYYQHLETWAH